MEGAWSWFGSDSTSVVEEAPPDALAPAVFSESAASESAFASAAPAVLLLVAVLSPVDLPSLVAVLPLVAVLSLGAIALYDGNLAAAEQKYFQ